MKAKKERIVIEMKEAGEAEIKAGGVYFVVRMAACEPECDAWVLNQPIERRLWERIRHLGHFVELETDTGRRYTRWAITNEENVQKAEEILGIPERSRWATWMRKVEEERRRREEEKEERKQLWEKYGERMQIDISSDSPRFRTGEVVEETKYFLVLKYFKDDKEIGVVMERKRDE